MDVGKDTSRRDGDAAEELVELLVVLDGESDVPGDDPGLLVVAGSVSGELEDLSAEVLEDGGEVDTGADSDPGCVPTLLEVAADTGNGELKPGLGGAADRLGRSTASLSFSFSYKRAKRRRRRSGVSELAMERVGTVNY